MPTMATGPAGRLRIERRPHAPQYREHQDCGSSDQLIPERRRQHREEERCEYLPYREKRIDSADEPNPSCLGHRIVHRSTSIQHCVHFRRLKPATLRLLTLRQRPSAASECAVHCNRRARSSPIDATTLLGLRHVRVRHASCPRRGLETLEEGRRTMETRSSQAVSLPRNDQSRRHRCGRQGRRRLCYGG
jgi:hypothetical protein